MLSGRWSSTLRSRLLEPAACRHTSCLRSAQSMPTKAANSVIDDDSMATSRSARVGSKDMGAWASEGSIGSRARADPEYSSNAQLTRGLEAGLVSVVCLALEIRSPRVHVLQ